MITSETGKALIQTCLNSPDSPPRSDPTTDQRMSATGFEETDLTYQVSESDSSGETKDALKPAFTVTNLPGTTSIQTAPTTSTSMQVSSGPSFPITNYLAPVSASISPNAVTSANGTVLKTTGASAVTSGGLMPIPTGFTLMSGGTMAQQVPVQAIQVHQAPQQTSPSSDSSTDLTQTSSSGTVTLPATIMTSSVPTTVGGHMMYPSPHAVMYAPTSGLADGGLAVLNAFPQAPSAMQVSHGQVQDQGGVPQVFLTAPSGTVQIPVSAVQLHQMAVIGQQSSSGSSLTELQVVNLDTSHSNSFSYRLHQLFIVAFSRFLHPHMHTHTRTHPPPHTQACAWGCRSHPGWSRAGAVQGLGHLDAAIAVLVSRQPKKFVFRGEDCSAL
ncbi:serum response factor isoform X1 [Geospiza fortis]|uniref:Serum response factor isoform X1 n=1 Tax=Geospiza fortis TaxID=48883 RepID=A0A8N5I536_GEOFO|nr:serum response factor isoform X1 [Geospiza fortis]